LISLEIPEGVERISKYAFYNWHKLTEVSIPSTLNEIGGSLFLQCLNLVVVDIAHAIQIIWKHLFDGCKSLRRIKIPSSVINIDSLRFVELQEDLCVIGDEVFSCNYALKHIDLPSTVTKIGGRAFANCIALSSIELLLTLEIIGDYSFLKCSSLANVALSTTVSLTVGQEIVKGCTKLNKAVRGCVLAAAKNRFDGLLIHKLCYYQGSLKSSLRNPSEQVIEIDPNESNKKKDIFGMTPMHIIALSSKPNLKFLEARAYKVEDILESRDAYDNSPMYYFCKNEGQIITQALKHVLLETF
jgi:hypothetical protein